MNQKIKLTHKKFYNKWIYKISLRINGIAILRSIGMAAAKDLSITAETSKHGFMISQRAWEHKELISEFSTFLDLYDPNTYAKRIESNIIDLYTNDIALYKKTYELFSHITVLRSEPKDLSLTLDTDINTIVVKKYPHNRYKHKVFLLPHKMKKDKTSKRRFVDWLKSQDPRITCSDAVEKWFMNTEWNWDRRYVLVEDEKTLLMLKLRNSEVVGRIYNYVLSDK